MNLEVLTKASQKIAKKYVEIEDIILYGSSRKGKEQVKDIDVLIIFKEQINKEAEYELKQTIKNSKVDLNSTTKKELEKEEYVGAEGIYLEGYSLLKKQDKAKEWHMKTLAILTYNTKNLSNTQKVKLHYILQGRGKEKGNLERYKAQKMSSNTILCQYNNIFKLEQLFQDQHIEYTIMPILTPTRIAKKIFSNQ